MKALLLGAIAICGSLFAGTVNLINDSPYTLRAVIRGADGSYLGEMVILSENTAQWSDQSYGAVPFNEYGNVERTRTPYTVMWYCMEGNDYSINTVVGTGSTVSAQWGQGSRQCKATDREKYPLSPSEGNNYEEHGYLYEKPGPENGTSPND